MEPVYFMPATGLPKKFEDVRVWCEVIRTEHADVPAKWYFFRADLNPQLKSHPFTDGALIAGEVYVDRANDPCELYFTDFANEGGKTLPHRMEVRNCDKRYAMFNLKVHQMK
jgi:hypothetical protein